MVAYIADPGILSVQSVSELSELLIASSRLGSAVGEGPAILAELTVLGLMCESLRIN